MSEELFTLIWCMAWPIGTIIGSLVFLLYINIEEKIEDRRFQKATKKLDAEWRSISKRFSGEDR